jgi:hypothetical protein
MFHWKKNVSCRYRHYMPLLVCRIVSADLQLGCNHIMVMPLSAWRPTPPERILVSAEATGGIVILDLKSSTTRSGKQWFPYIGKGPRKILAGFAWETQGYTLKLNHSNGDNVANPSAGVDFPTNHGCLVDPPWLILHLPSPHMTPREAGEALDALAKRGMHHTYHANLAGQKPSKI